MGKERAEGRKKGTKKRWAEVGAKNGGRELFKQINQYQRERKFTRALVEKKFQRGNIRARTTLISLK